MIPEFFNLHKDGYSIIMTISNTETIFFSLLSSGVIATLITIVSNFYLFKRKERLAYLREQIDKFYGPIFYGYFQKEVLHALCSAVAVTMRGSNDHANNKISLYEKHKKELICHLQEFNVSLQNMLKINISLIDIADIDKYLHGIKALKAICSYHAEHDIKEREPSHALTIFTQERLLIMLDEAGSFFKLIEDKFNTKKNELVNFNGGFDYPQKIYTFLKSWTFGKAAQLYRNHTIAKTK